jgi:hypothetical protein
MSVNGNAGVSFNITEEVDTDTGRIVQVQSVPSAIANLLIDSEDIVYSISGEVGPTPITIDLGDVNNQSGADYSITVVRNNDGDFSYLKALVVYNTDIENSIIIGAASSENLFTWNGASDGIRVEPLQAMTFIYPEEISISSAGKFKLTGSAEGATLKMWILGGI